MNYPKAFVECPNLTTRARFYEPHMPMIEGSPYKTPYLLPDHTGVDYESLPLQGLFAFNEQYELFKEFSSRSDAAQQCGLGNKYYQVSRYINKRFITVVIGGVSMKLLFAQNPLVKGGRKQVTCLNIETNEVTLYKSINACLRDLELNPGSVSGFINNYIKPGKPYKGKYLITYTK